MPEARWGVHRVAKRLKDVDQQRTMLMGLPGERPADPTRMVCGEVIGPVVHGEPVDPGALRRLYEILVSYDPVLQRASVSADAGRAADAA